MRRQYELTVRQEPKQARMRGIGGKGSFVSVTIDCYTVILMLLMLRSLPYGRLSAASYHMATYEYFVLIPVLPYTLPQFFQNTYLLVLLTQR
ncbi:hypothetical protein B0H16DRAFT_1638986 [Mycena metata]|uniref:Uncharacterized protein n=1 Tax=Mycena metata TaxID=1033252 RepID=A0AAD7E1U4_9AGAR|nr:hypothetical protein B0H16DRAFT_1638986 [Mycena metata]